MTHLAARGRTALTRLTICLTDLLIVIFLAATLAACASDPPIHYYTLLAPAGPLASAPAATGAAAPLRFDLLPVSLPAQVDQQPMVVRQGGQAVLLLENERWIAPLGQEMRNALSAELAQRLGGTDVSGLPLEASAPVLRIKVEVRRFESVLADHVLIEADWSLRRAAGTQEAEVILCSSRILESVQAAAPDRRTTGPLDDMVRGHQRALARLATHIAETATSWTQRRGQICAVGLSGALP